MRLHQLQQPPVPLCTPGQLAAAGEHSKRSLPCCIPVKAAELGEESWISASHCAEVERLLECYGNGIKWGSAFFCAYGFFPFLSPQPSKMTDSYNLQASWGCLYQPKQGLFVTFLSFPLPHHFYWLAQLPLPCALTPPAEEMSSTHRLGRRTILKKELGTI